MMDYVDFTNEHTAHPRTDLAHLRPQDWDFLIIGDLIKTADDRILLPLDRPEEANIFVVYAASTSEGGREVIVAECRTLADAVRFIEKAEANGWKISNWLLGSGRHRLFPTRPQ